MKKRNMMKPAIVGVIGENSADEEVLSLAEELGRRIAEKGFALLNGGGTGIMEAASQGAFNTGGLVIGILPTDRNSPNKGYPNEYVNIPIYMSLSDGRNVIIAKSTDVIVALGCGYGTISSLPLSWKT